MAAQGQTAQPKGGSHGWKRQHPEEPSPQEDSPPICWKRQRTDSCSGSELSWTYPPRFWDRLSSIPLVHNALKELERRTLKRPSIPSRPILPAQKLIPTATGELARFARHGGPDLRDLRGYPYATRRHRPAGAMSSPLRHQGANATDPSTLPTPVTTPISKKSDPYDAAFWQHLTDHQVHPPTYDSERPELAEVVEALNRRRRSVSDLTFPFTILSAFRTNNADAKDEADVLADVIPTITGPKQADHPCSRNTLFGNLKPLTDDTIVSAKPDIYYGTLPTELDRSIRDELAGHIIPSTMTSKPIAPNFFLEVKGPNGNANVANLQARYAGAIGARAMHGLQSYNKEESIHDKNSYTLSATYYFGFLNIYAHRITAPTTPEGRPGYHMTLVGSWSLIGNIDSFRSGVAAFRNARDLAKQYRDRFVREANVRGTQARVAAAQADATEPREHDIWAPHHSVDSAQRIPLQDADDGQLQQKIDEGDGERTTAVSHHLHTEDDF